MQKCNPKYTAMDFFKCTQECNLQAIFLSKCNHGTIGQIQDILEKNWGITE